MVKETRVGVRDEMKDSRGGKRREEKRSGKEEGKEISGDFRIGKVPGLSIGSVTWLYFPSTNPPGSLGLHDC